MFLWRMRLNNVTRDTLNPGRMLQYPPPTLVIPLTHIYIQSPHQRLRLSNGHLLWDFQIKFLYAFFPSSHHASFINHTNIGRRKFVFLQNIKNQFLYLPHLTMLYQQCELWWAEYNDNPERSAGWSWKEGVQFSWLDSRRRHEPNMTASSQAEDQNKDILEMKHECQ
jgi:hypothetical protein